MPARHRSSIPSTATERVVGRYPDGARSRSEYLIGGEVVGVRSFHEAGGPAFEYALRDGQRHGMECRWDRPGRMTSAIPYADGVPHGTAKQWDDHGRLVGTYRLARGTGIDLWRQQREDGSAYLAEVFHWRDGRGDGFEWWVNEDQATVYIERHWRAGTLHGIEREWNNSGRLRRGFPKYHVEGEHVTKRRYLRACRADPSLPPFKEEDGRPDRVFPPEVARHLRHPQV